MPAHGEDALEYDPLKAGQYLQAEQSQRRKLAAAEAVSAVANIGKRVMLCGKVIQAFESSALVIWVCQKHLATLDCVGSGCP